MPLTSSPLAILLLTSALVLAPLSLTDGVSGLGAAAWAQDDDGGDDDGGDDDDDDGGSGAGAGAGNGDGRRQDNLQRRATRVNRAPSPRAQQAAPLAEFAPEIVVADLSEPDRTLLLTEGFDVISDDLLPGNGGLVTRLSAPAGLSIDAARARVRLLPSGEEADFNHYYRSGQSVEGTIATTPSACEAEICAAHGIVDWPGDRATCPVNVTVGVIDTGVNAEHQILQGAQVKVVALSDAAQDPSRAVHGTAVVSLLAGAVQSTVPGLIPEARLVVADVFVRGAGRVGGDERADVVSLMKGLDLMGSEGARVVNMSLSGPQNTVLDQAITRFIRDEDIVIVASVGNAGPDAPPAFPASHPGVIAVTAVDQRSRVYGRAQRGDHVDLAAPGVNLLLATSISGARLKTGTSFAAPFVTAAAALLLSQGLTPAEVAARLAATARDLGVEGRDELFGNGLISAQDFCPQQRSDAERE